MDDATTARVAPREPQYTPAFNEPAVTLGPMASHSYRHDPKHLGFTLARYKFVAKMLAGYNKVAEFGCGDGFGGVVVRQVVGDLFMFDFDPHCVAAANKSRPLSAAVYDISEPYADYPKGARFDAIYMVDVIEHLDARSERHALRNFQKMLLPNGVVIIGTPSLESQAYASPQSKAGHVNCRSGDALKSDMLKYFNTVFLFGMNDEVLHVGFAPMCHYLFAVCVGVRQ